MKRILAVLIAMMMMLGMTSYAETGAVLKFGPYGYDTTGSVEYGEPSNGYSMIDYGSYVVTIEFFDLAGNGFDQAFFDNALDGDADSWEIGSYLLATKYSPNAENQIYAWFVEEPVDTSYPIAAVLYNGELLADLGSGAMAGIAYVYDGTLLLLEVIAFGNQDLAEIQSLRVDMIGNLTLNGESLSAGSSSAPAADGASISAPSMGALGGMLTGGSSNDSDDDVTAPALSGLGGGLAGSTDDADATDAPSGGISIGSLGGAFGGSTVSGTATIPAAIENGICMGNYTYDTTGCETYELDGDLLNVDYGSRVVYIEYDSFADNGITFAELSDMYGGLDHVGMAEMFFGISSYGDPESTMYTGCRIENVSFTTIPEGVMFSGNLTDDYGGGYVTGCVLVSDNELLLYECVSFSFGDTLESMQNFRLETLGKLYYNGVPVLQ